MQSRSYESSSGPEDSLSEYGGDDECSIGIMIVQQKGKFIVEGTFTYIYLADGSISNALYRKDLYLLTDFILYGADLFIPIMDFLGLEQGGAAQQSGSIQVGDVIIQVEGTPSSPRHKKRAFALIRRCFQASVSLENDSRRSLTFCLVLWTPSWSWSWSGQAHPVAPSPPHSPPLTFVPPRRRIRRAPSR